MLECLMRRATSESCESRGSTPESRSKTLEMFRLDPSRFLLCLGELPLTEGSPRSIPPQASADVDKLPRPTRTHTQTIDQREHDMMVYEASTLCNVARFMTQMYMMI